jgi:hypothetical protein
VTEEWYRFERDRRATVTRFTLGGIRARTGAKGTRFFERHIVGRSDAKQVVLDALGRMDYVRTRWPREKWPQPTGLEKGEAEIVLPALMLAAGRSEAEVDRVVESRGESA